MTVVQVALYARVSSEQQAEAKTIESQLAELRTRITADGLDLACLLEFVDDGYSGSTLVRPALERLRDVAAAGGIDPSRCASRGYTPSLASFWQHHGRRVDPRGLEYHMRAALLYEPTA